MKKTILIIGAGTGVSQAAAERFGKEGFAVGLINRDPLKAAALIKHLTDQQIKAYSVTADVANDEELAKAIDKLSEQLGGIDVLLYNAADLTPKDILGVSQEQFMTDFKINVAAALKSVQLAYDQLKQSRGAVLLTGGGFATHPSPDQGTLSIGKAGIRNLALQLNERLETDGVYAGTLTITAMVTPESEVHSPARLAQVYWEMYRNRTEAELVI